MQLDDAGTGCGVEIASRLIGEQDPWMIRERAGDGDALLLAARQLRRKVVHAIAEPDASEQLDRACRRAALAAKLERYLHVLQRGERGNELKALEDEPNFLTAQSRPLVLGEAPEIDAVEDHGAVRGGIESGQQSEQGRLAAAGWPDDRDERALRYRERHVAEHGELVRSALEFFRQLSSNEHA